MVAVTELAKNVRSTHAGPARITIDILFEDASGYERAKDVIDTATIAELYGIREDDVCGIYVVDAINAIKFTFKSPVTSGDLDCGDWFMHNMHAPALSLEIPE